MKNLLSLLIILASINTYGSCKLLESIDVEVSAGKRIKLNGASLVQLLALKSGTKMDSTLCQNFSIVLDSDVMVSPIKSVSVVSGGCLWKGKDYGEVKIPFGAEFKTNFGNSSNVFVVDGKKVKWDSNKLGNLRLGYVGPQPIVSTATFPVCETDFSNADFKDDVNSMTLSSIKSYTSKLDKLGELISGSGCSVSVKVHGNASNTGDNGPNCPTNEQLAKGRANSVIDTVFSRHRNISIESSHAVTPSTKVEGDEEKLRHQFITITPRFK